MEQILYGDITRLIEGIDLPLSIFVNKCVITQGKKLSCVYFQFVLFSF